MPPFPLTGTPTADTALAESWEQWGPGNLPVLLTSPPSFQFQTLTPGGMSGKITAVSFFTSSLDCLVPLTSFLFLCLALLLSFYHPLSFSFFLLVSFFLSDLTLFTHFHLKILISFICYPSPSSHVFILSSSCWPSKLTEIRLEMLSQRIRDMNVLQKKMREGGLNSPVVTASFTAKQGQSCT